MSLDLDELERLAQAATPGPWCMDGRWLGTEMSPGTQGAPLYEISPMITGEIKSDDANLALIAAAPQLIAALRASQAENARLRQELSIAATMPVSESTEEYTLGWLKARARTALAGGSST